MQSVAILGFFPIFVFADKPCLSAKRLKFYLKLAVWNNLIAFPARHFSITFSSYSQVSERLPLACLQIIHLLTITFKIVYNQNDEYEKN
jgi:hypothetical protein